MPCTRPGAPTIANESRQATPPQHHVECACTDRAADGYTRERDTRLPPGGRPWHRYKCPAPPRHQRTSNGHAALTLRQVPNLANAHPKRSADKTVAHIVGTHGDETSEALWAITSGRSLAAPRCGLRKPINKRSAALPHATTSRSAFISAHCFSYSMTFATRSTNASSLPKRESR